VLGGRTSKVELTNMSPNGLWLPLDGCESFVSFREFPWFADGTIEQLAAVERPSRHHPYWPALDVDLAVESLDHPERFPLLSRVRPGKRSGRVKTRGGHAAIVRQPRGEGASSGAKRR